MIECAETCNVDKDSASAGTVQAGQQPGQAACSRCPPCVRCPIAHGLSSKPMVQPGFGLPRAYGGRSIAELLDADGLMVTSATRARPTISVYKCLKPEFCSGDHWIVDRALVHPDNVGTVLRKPRSISEDAEWHEQLVSLAAGAGIRVESENDFSESTLGSSLAELSNEQLATLLYVYYVGTTQHDQTLSSVELEAKHLELAAIWREKQPQPLFDMLMATYPLRPTVVVPDDRILLVNPNSSDTQTAFSCSTGHNSTSPLCALCEPGYAGGSTHTCKHCTSGTTGIRVLAFLLVLALGWVLVTYLPAWIIEQAKARMQSNLHDPSSDSGDLRVVGAANAQGGSTFTYTKIIVSHFQILLQFSIIMRVTFPPAFQNILDYLSVFKGDLLNYLNLKCAVQLNLYSGFAVTMGIPPFALVVCAIANAVQAARRPRQQVGVGSDAQVVDGPAGDLDEVTKKDGLLNQMFAVLFCVYPFLGAKICHVFKCVSLRSSAYDVEEWQQYNMEVDCSDPLYKSLQSVALLMFLIYPIGVPAITIFCYVKNFTRLHGLQSAPVARERATLPPEFQMEHTKLPWWHGDRDTFHFMVRDYQPKYFFFEIVEFVRKFSLTGLLIFAEQGSASQIVFGISLAFGFGLLNAIVRPYVDARTNTFRILSDCSLFVTLLIVLVLHFKDTLVTVRTHPARLLPRLTRVLCRPELRVVDRGQTAVGAHLRELYLPLPGGHARDAAAALGAVPTI